MRRRTFVETAALALATAGAPAQTPPAKTRQAALKLGTQNDSSDPALRVLAALGVDHICSTLPSARMDANWSVEGLTRLRERVESFGIRLEMIPLPMSSSSIDKSENPGIMLGKSPERDREIDTICQMIRNAARAGIPALKYNMTILGVVRSEPSRGRGGARYSTFEYDKAAQVPPLTEAGPVNADAMWERIAYFLERVIPVAEEYKMQNGLPSARSRHAARQRLSRRGSRARQRCGAEAVYRNRASPYHGLNFCQGTVSEMLRQAGGRNLRRDPLFRVARQDFQRALPQYPGRLLELSGDVSGRWRREHDPRHARLSRRWVMTAC